MAASVGAPDVVPSVVRAEEEEAVRRGGGVVRRLLKLVRVSWSGTRCVPKHEQPGEPMNRAERCVCKIQQQGVDVLYAFLGKGKRGVGKRKKRAFALMLLLHSVALLFLFAAWRVVLSELYCIHRT